MEEKLRKFLKQYIGRDTQGNDIATQEDVDLLVFVATDDHIEQEIIDYGTAHPEAPFWDLLKLIPPMTLEEMEAVQREIDSEPDDED